MEEDDSTSPGGTDEGMVRSKRWSAVTVPFSLSSAQLAAVRQEMEQIHVFEYPPVFEEKMSGRTTCRDVVYDTYALRIRLRPAASGQGGQATREMTLRWDDNVCQNYDPTAVQLRALFSQIIDMVKSSEAYRKLPSSGTGRPRR